MVRAARSGHSRFYDSNDSNQINDRLTGGAGSLRSVMRIACSNGRGRRGTGTVAWVHTVVIVVVTLIGAAAAAVPALAEHTRWWKQDSFEDFDKGTAKGVALRSDGKL